MDQKRVLIVTINSKVDLEPARAKGAITVLFDRSAGVELGSPFEPEKICKTIRKRLLDIKYDPTKDLVAIYGSFVYMTCFAGVLATDYGVVKVLVFNAADSSYVEREIDFRGLR